jgi:hypothetical protein
MIQTGGLRSKRVREISNYMIGYLSYVTLKKIVNKDYEEWLKLNSIENGEEQTIEPQETDDKGLKENMLRVSADFKIEIQDHQSILDNAKDY